MLKFFDKGKECSIFSPIMKGQLIRLEEVPDNVFASKMMGDGVGFINQDNKIVAPFNGTIIMTQPSMHAIGIRAVNGAEILIHIGLDTVELHGSGFYSNIHVGDKVKKGEILVTYNLDFMKEKQIDLTTPMILTNANEYDLEILMEEGNITLGDEVMICKKK